MQEQPSVHELLSRWRQMHEQGQTVSAEDLCADCPERLDELKRQLRDLASMEAFLHLGAAEGASEPSHGAAADSTLTQRGHIDAARGATRGAAPPAAIAGFMIVSELGRGGMGVVYEAQQLSLKRSVALKMVLAGSQAGAEQLGRFRVEAEAIARLQHPNIVQVYEVGEADGRPYFAMELVIGGSLASRLRQGPVTPAEAAALVETLARAVQHAHQRGIIHRDLKPANVLLTEEGAPKVTDFGLAKQLESDLGQTQTGAVMGTPSYMAPEQAAGDTREIGPATDIYALGAILYELLTGVPPFRGPTMLDTLEQVRFKEPVRPARLRPGVVRDLETVCLKCLAKEPERRYASAFALAQDLERFRRGEAILARPEGPAGKLWRKVRRHRLAVGASVVVAVTLAAAGAVFLASGEARQKASRDRTVTEAHQAIDAGPPQGEWSAGHLARMDGLVAELGELVGPQEADAARERVHKQFRQVIGSWIVAPRLDQESIARIEQGLGLLARRDPAGAQKLRQDLKSRLQDWQTVFDLPADPVDRVFDPSSGVTWDGSRLRLPPRAQDKDQATGPNLKVLSRQVSPSDARLEGVFDEGWEQATAVGLLLNVTPGHSQAILSLGFSADGQTLVSASGAHNRPGEVIVWDVARRRERATYRPGKPGILSASLAPDGARLAIGNSSDAQVVFIDPATGRTIGGFTADPTGVAWLTYSPDGKRLATGTGTSPKSGEVSLWDPVTGEKKGTLGGLQRPVARLTFSPDGKLLAAGSDDGRIMIWDVATRQVRLATAPMHVDFPSCGRFSPDSRYFVAPAHTDEKAPGKVVIPALRWEVDSGQVKSFPTHGAASGLSALAFAPDGKALATASAWSWSVHLHDETSGVIRTFLQTTPPANRIFTALEFAPDGRTLAVAGDDHSIGLWDVASGSPHANLGRTAYRFVLAAREVATSKTGALKAPPLSAVRTAGGAFSLQIVGAGGLLRERQELANRIPAGPLRLTASRARGQLSFQVNDLPLVTFEDALAPGGGTAGGVFGVTGPAGLSLQKLRASCLTLPPAASPLERGDDLYEQAQFVEALAWYQEQARTSGAGAVGQEARTKAARCLAALRRDAEALALLERVAADDDARWSIVAGDALVTARMREGGFADAVAVLEALVKRHGPDRLAGLFPVEKRTRLVLGLAADFDKLNLYLARPDATVLHNLERARAIQEAFRDPPAARLPVQEALVHAYHLAGRLDEALAIAEDLVTKPHYWNGRADAWRRSIAVERDSWLLRQKGLPARALARMDEYLPRTPADDRPEALALLIERARVQIALGRPQEAEKDLEAYFRRSPAETKDYLAFGNACLVRGFLREQRGDSAGALAAWREGLYENWHRAAYKAEPGATPRPLSQVRGNALLAGLLLASLTGELSDADAQEILLRLTSRLDGTGPAGLYQKAVLRVPPAVLREMCRTAKGREAARHVAFQDVSYAHYLRTPGLLIAAEMLHQGALPGPLAQEHGVLVWDVAEKLHGAYADKKLASSQFFQLALAWKGTTNFLGWGGVAPTLAPTLRGPLAYVMAHRYVRLGRPQDAAPFFRTALQDAPPGSVLSRLARAAVEQGAKK